MTSDTVSRKEFDELKVELDELRKSVDSGSKKRKDKKDRKPRTPSPYNIFMSEEMKKLRVKNPDTPNKEIFKMAVEAWRNTKE